MHMCSTAQCIFRLLDVLPIAQHLVDSVHCLAPVMCVFALHANILDGSNIFLAVICWEEHR